MTRTAILDRTQGRQEAYAAKNISTQGFRGLRNAFLLAATVAVSAANAQPTFTKVFSPSTIGPGSVSTLTFTITNGTGAPVTDLAFTDILPTSPGDVDIATPPNASTTCDDGVVTAPAGGGTISLSDGDLGDGETCTVTVDVTAGTAGTHTNTSGALTSTPLLGDPPTATADLIVVTTLPGFSQELLAVQRPARLEEHPDLHYRQLPQRVVCPYSDLHRQPPGRYGNRLAGRCVYYLHLLFHASPYCRARNQYRQPFWRRRRR